MSAAEPITDNAIGIYEAIAKLAEVRPDLAHVQLAARIEDLGREAAGTIRAAREALILHGQVTNETIGSLRDAAGVSDDIHDGLFELMNQASGADALHVVMDELSRFICPDGSTIEPNRWIEGDR